MKSDARASLDDLAIRWETPRGREVKAEILQDIRHNKGERLAEILKDFIYSAEVADGRDLRCITLEDTDLSDTTWKKCDLSWASFARSNLTRADFREANLKRANLAETNCSLARFAEADCARVDFTKANLEHANFKETKMNGAVFVSSNCTRASFDTANLVKCNFVGANLEQANFSNADCNNSNFSGGGMDQAAAKPGKAWGIVYDMALDEFERKVGLNSLTSRTTKKFKGLDVLLKASAALAKVTKKTGMSIPVADDLALGAPPGMKRLETFKRMEDDGGVVFGATLKKPADEKKSTREMASASDYIDEPSTFDPDDPNGTHYPEQDEPTAEGLGITEEAVGAVWTDGRPEDETSSDEGSAAAYAEAEPPPAAPPIPTPTPRAQTRPVPQTPVPPGGAPGAGSSGRVTRPPAPPAPTGPRPTGQMPVPGTTPPGGIPIPARTTKNLGPPVPGGAPAPTSGKFPPMPGGAPVPGGAPGGGQTARLRPPAPPGSGPAPAAPPGMATPAPGAPRAPTRNLSRPDAGTTPPVAAPKPAAPAFMSPLDPSAPEPVADWAKAIGQLMQSKGSITKIVIEMGDKSRVVFKKG